MKLVGILITCILSVSVYYTAHRTLVMIEKKRSTKQVLYYVGYHLLFSFSLIVVVKLFYY